MKGFFKNFLYVFGAQILVLLISVARALLVPKILPVEGFGYWEIYLLYTSYVGIFALGYVDGIYLKYGECNFDQLPFQKLRSATRLFCLVLVAFVILTSGLFYWLVQNPEEKLAMIFAAFNIFVLGLSSYFIYIFQITNQFKKYSFFSVLDKIAVLVTIILMLFINADNYRYIVITDFLSKLAVLILMIIKMPELLIGEGAVFKESLSFMWSNMTVGVKLMIANLMSMLIVGAGRFIVQYMGDITDFATYSFGVSVTGLVLTAITSIGLVLYPTIKRHSPDKFGEDFNTLNSTSRIISICSLLVYYPVFIFVQYFYPKYFSVLPYLSYLFLVVFCTCKINLVNNTFYKVLRQEKQMLIANLSCVAFFIIIALIFFPMTKDVSTIAICTFAAMFMRSYSSEFSIGRFLNIPIDKRTFLEFVVITVFILSCEFLSLDISCIVMSIIVIAYLILDRKALKNVINLARK